ncbi:Cof-type HAD-IIB family hydrolase [Leptospira santarosai]|uniref:Cof-type HAD-IIB family hydrolase n=1 Tax=Leptospira santarosai TaxID=28183 RepID=UPI0007733E25|nr:Cof-type HAD-IIB family hydrolase [Leptospira santarosai]MDI7186560.1 Cof-type HAD-IIB family hydrolase [Leptospira santarosai]MDI7200560.1 Cof-type HAD-IIB family hydrolase [Leptospira santarosai]MDI7210655.1 Cof-type HAD-IIB family hydrolase [Leptospira santarosai]MDI7214314.1 Cof-type HAD-IIB family hydrolase [Leptospira santarosai]MDI7221396.1 Cof-type HAD-IIB family hydrolase [Leptospira santarosai]
MSIDPTQIHTIAVDLDGTLLNSKSKISPLTHSVLQKAIDQGKNLVIATGRRFHSTFPFAKEFKGEVHVVSNNGQILRKSPSAERIAESYLDLRLVQKILHLGFHTPPILHVDKFEEGIDMLTEVPITDGIYHNYSGGDHSRTREVGDFLSADLEKILVICFLSLRKEDLNSLIRKVSALPEASELRCILTKIPGVSYCVEIINVSVSKWSGISRFLSLKGLDGNGVVAFGDERNDLEMLLHCGAGFAMKNAIPEIKKSAKHVTRYSNEEDGVALSLVENRIVLF